MGCIHVQLLHELAMPDVFQVSLMYVCFRLKVGCFYGFLVCLGRMDSAQVYIICVHPMSCMLEYSILGVCSIFLLFVGCRL